MLRTVDTESGHGSKFGVDVGSGYVLPIESGFSGPQTDPPARKTRFVPLVAQWIKDPESCGS